MRSVWLPILKNIKCTTAQAKVKITTQRGFASEPKSSMAEAPSMLSDSGSLIVVLQPGKVPLTG
jgi:hypothetical protein